MKKFLDDLYFTVLGFMIMILGACCVIGIPAISIRNAFVNLGIPEGCVFIAFWSFCLSVFFAGLFGKL